MKVADIIASPSTRTEAWWDSSHTILSEVFGVDYYDLDYDMAEVDQDHTISYEEKYSLSHGWDDWTHVHVIKVFATPAAIIVMVPGGGTHVFSLNEDAIHDGQKHLLKYRTPPATRGLVPLEMDEELDFGPVVELSDGKMHLVHAEQVDTLGKPIFDKLRYREAFDEIIRPVYRDTPEVFHARPLDRKDVRFLLSRVLVKSAAGDCIAWPESIEKNGDWVGAIIEGVDGNRYEVYMPSYHMHSTHLSWGSCFRVRRAT